MKHIDNDALVIKITNQYHHSDKTMWVEKNCFSVIESWMKQDREKATPFIPIPLLIQCLKEDKRKIDSLKLLDYPEEYSEKEIGATLLYCDEYHDVENPLGSIQSYIESLIFSLEEFTKIYGVDIAYEGL